MYVYAGVIYLIFIFIFYNLHGFLLNYIYIYISKLKLSKILRNLECSVMANWGSA